MNANAENKQDNIFRIVPTCTSTINRMDVTYDPRLALGIIQGNSDLKNLDDYNYVNKIRVLKSIDTILKDEVEHIGFDQVAFYFAEKVKNKEDFKDNIALIGSQYSAHLANKTEKIKNKSKPMPSPSDGSPSPKKKEELENQQKHELAQKKSLQMTPFKIPNPMK